MGVQDRKAREFERRGREILDAALALFKADDWEQVTVAQIARHAEVGKGTIYKHFVSKDEIYARLAMAFQQRLIARFERIDGRLPVIERFRQHLRAAWDIHLSSQELHRVFLFCGRAEFRVRLSAQTLTELQEIERRLALPTQQLVREGINQGVFPDKPVDLLLFGAQSAFWGAIQLIWSGYLGEMDRVRQLDEVTRFVLAGLIHQDRAIDPQ